MPDHKEMGRTPTDRERELAFAPHESPRKQGDGDPGRKPRPRLEPDDTEDKTSEPAPEPQADGDAG